MLYTKTIMEKNKIIEVSNLVAKFGDKTVLDGINMDVYKNEIMVILGASGCGKTTLLKHIIGLYYPVSGSVKIFDKEITELDEPEMEEILKKIGVLFQNGALLNSLTIRENVAMPIKQHTNLPDSIIDRLVKVKLDLVDLSYVIDLLPSELSGGMRKRAALARAIAFDPLLFFGDEPSAGLDPVTAASLDELILKLKKQLKMTIVIVTHELASIHHIADRVLFLDEGRVLFSGNLEDAKKSNIKKIEEFFEKGKY